MVILHCQLDRIWNHQEDAPLCVSVGVFPEMFNLGGLTLNVCGSISWTVLLGQTKRRENNE